MRQKQNMEAVLVHCLLLQRFAHRVIIVLNIYDLRKIAMYRPFMSLNMNNSDNALNNQWHFVILISGTDGLQQI